MAIFVSSVVLVLKKMESVLNKFLRYISFDTMSDEDSSCQPSTSKQLLLQEQLTNELKALGIKATLDKNGYVMAEIPSNTDKEIPAIGFIAHVDTSPDAPGVNVRPQIISNYEGTDILLGKSGKYLKVDDFPELKQYIGQTIITTDGTTLLGADDKAGVAEIMCVAEYIVSHPEFKHGKICIAFTPDEEIGRGVVAFDISAFGADYAYTVDGGMIGELEYENFNAASVKIDISGLNIHPGYAKDKMVNALLVAIELNNMLPNDQRPENTEGYEGFFHLTSLCGVVEHANVNYIIRDHDLTLFEEKKNLIRKCVDTLNIRYGDIINCEIKDQYYNMKEKIVPHYHIVENAIKGMRIADVEPIIKPIRGGTDGASLSFKGLPCPNIFAGGHNFHGKMEFIPLESMEKAVEVIKNIIKEYFEK